MGQRWIQFYRHSSFSSKWKSFSYELDFSCSPTHPRTAPACVRVNVDAVCRDRHPTRRARLGPLTTTLSSKGLGWWPGTASYGLY